MDSAFTWFFERLRYEYDHRLEIDLVEGIRLDEQEPVKFGDSTSVYAYPMKVLETSRCVTVVAEGVLAYQVVDESYNAPSDNFEYERNGIILKCTSLQYLKYIEDDSIMASVVDDEYAAYLVWSEDNIFFIVSFSPPEVVPSNRKPDLSINRYRSYSTTKDRPGFR